MHTEYFTVFLYFSQFEKIIYKKEKTSRYITYVWLTYGIEI